jgi:hypothetical protein
MGQALIGAALNRIQGACKVAEPRKSRDKLPNEYEASSRVCTYIYWCKKSSDGIKMIDEEKMFGEFALVWKKFAILKDSLEVFADVPGDIDECKRNPSETKKKILGENIRAFYGKSLDMQLAAGEALAVYRLYTKYFPNAENVERFREYMGFVERLVDDHKTSLVNRIMEGER